ncbi:alpha-1-antitrypsin-like isoform X2 [Ranitomeya imitator]|uniref:alpha-1-antitrypsin-like isoform X2 n=1 Tax=Ranitomeya imitator TaxID=111125 RepID=UPI0037E97865
MLLIRSIYGNMRVFLFLETALLFPLVFAENGKTAELLHRVNQDVISVLIDCIYSRAKLDNLFDIKTEYRDFYIDKSTTVKMPFLRTTGIYNVAFTDEAAVVSIPYKSDAKVLFILPEEEKLSEIENNLSKETIQKWTKSMDMRYMDLSLPKFSVSATINIKDVSLKVLADLFPDISDISGITGEANVKVSRAVRKDIFSLDENETDSVNSATLRAIPTMRPHPRILFNRPFLTVIIREDNIIFKAKFF